MSKGHNLFIPMLTEHLI